MPSVADRELEQTFDVRWQQLALDETLVDPAATLRSDQPAESNGGMPVRVRSQLPYISIDYRSDVAAAPASGDERDPDLEVRATLGEGGMGRVHLARQRSLDRDVAVKTLKPDAPERARLALLTEATITGSLEHPGIIPVHALGVEHSGRPVLVMKRVEGTEWRQLIHDDAHPAWSHIPESDDRLDAHLEILSQLCNAVHFAHSRGVVHCDIKPENVMVGSFGEVYLVDWGVATRLGATRGGELVGSPAYMAPEMTRGGVVDARTDVYLLGATLHEVLTREPRHPGANLHAVLFHAFRSEPHSYDPSVPDELAELCNRATHREPGERPATARAFRQALAEVQRHKSSTALAQAAAERLGALQALLRDDPSGEGEPTRAHRLINECRFGFAQALKEWPENPGARAGLAACLEAATEMELGQGNAAAARALLDELATPHPELEQRLAELEARLREQAAKNARLERIEHDMDMTVGAVQHSRALTAMAVIVLLVSGTVMLRGIDELSARDTVWIALGINAASWLGIFVWRKKLLQNAFTRRTIGLAVVTMGGLLLNRLLSLRFGVAPNTTLSKDLVLMLVVMSLAVLTVAGRLAWAVLPLALGVAVAWFEPRWTPFAFTASTFAAVITIVLLWRRIAAGSRS